jgi:hypothetical protein
VTAIGLAVVFSGAVAAFAGSGVSAVSANAAGSARRQIVVYRQGRTFSGVITDDRCGARHQPNFGQNSSECARMCIRNGAKYLLVDGGRSYWLDGNPDELGRLAGERASIVGTLNGNTIRVSSVTPGL